MPLTPGSSEKVIGENIAELERAGHKPDQAIAIAESEARRSAKDAATYAGIMFVAGGRVLLMRRTDASDNGGLWAFPAGAVEMGETEQQAAIREAWEETGYQADPDSVVAHSMANDFALFVCRCEQFAPKLNEEHDGYVWARPDRLPAPLHPGCAEAIVDCAMDAAPRAPAQIALPLTTTVDAVQLADALDRAETARQLDINGWTEIKGNPLSKVGVFPYLGRQIPGAPEPDKAYMVYRPEEELSDPACIESFKLIPWIDNHVMLGSEDDGLTPAERKGVQGVVGEDVSYSEGVLRANIKVFSQAMKRLIDSGKRELSCGYRCVYDWTPGIFQGQRYDAVQRQIRGNHLALVQSGRMGPDVAVLDSLGHFVFALDVGDAAMADEKKDDEKKDESKQEKPGDQKAGGDSTRSEAAAEKPEMSHEDFLGALKKFLPIAEKMISMTRPASEAEGMAGGAGAKDTDEDKPGAKNETPGNDPAETKKETEAMDAAAQFKSFAKQFAERDTLARRLSQHVGTFDHSEMTVAEVAKYGIEKLGIKAPPGAEAAALEGYLQAKGDPARAAVAAAAAQDAKPGNFVDKFLAA